MGDLVSAATAASWIGVPNDANLQFAVSAISQLMADWCNRVFTATDLVEVYDGPGGTRMITRNYPIISIASLSVNGLAQVVSPGFGKIGYTSDGNRIIDLTGTCFDRGRQNVALSYRAGYATIPMDLQLACLNWVKDQILSRDRDGSIVSHRAGDTEEKFAAGGAVTNAGDGTGLVPMPASVFAVLTNYRNVVPV